MNRSERNVEKERFLASRTDPFDRFVGKKISDVTFLVDQLLVAVPGRGPRTALVEMAVGSHATGQGAIAVIESKMIRTFIG